MSETWGTMAYAEDLKRKIQSHLTLMLPCGILGAFPPLDRKFSIRHTRDTYFQIRLVKNSILRHFLSFLAHVWFRWPYWIEIDWDTVCHFGSKRYKDFAKMQYQTQPETLGNNISKMEENWGNIIRENVGKIRYKMAAITLSNSNS